MLKSDLLWGYAAQVLNIGLGLIMLPVLVRYMSPAEVGLWFVFITLISLVQLLELGFMPTLSRNFAYIYAGTQKLSAFGLQDNGNGPLNISLLANLVAAARWTYLWITLVAAAVLIFGGTIYITRLLQPEHDTFKVLAGWFALVVGSIINLYFNYLNAVLLGRGDVTAANKVVIGSRSIQVIFGVISVVAGFGLLGLGIASILSAIISRVLARRYVFTRQHPEMIGLVANAEGTKILIGTLWHNASRFGIVLLGVFLIWRANIFIASSYLGLEDAASYGLAVQIFTLLNTIATVPFNLSLPKLNSLRARKKNAEVYKTFSALLVSAIIMYVIAALFVLFMGNYLLDIIGSSTKLPNNWIMLLMAVVFLLEINHGTCSNFITTGNHVPFVHAAVISGLCIVVLSVFLAPIYGLGGLVMSQGVVQVLYNNWKWPMEVGKIFNVPYFKMLFNGLIVLKKSLIAEVMGICHWMTSSK